MREKLNRWQCEDVKWGEILVNLSDVPSQLFQTILTGHGRQNIMLKEWTFVIIVVTIKMKNIIIPHKYRPSTSNFSVLFKYVLKHVLVITHASTLKVGS